MNELFDKLIIRIVFAILICLTLIFYKYLHIVFYPSARKQLFRTFYPSKNPADTLHLFSRILGVGIILSGFHFYLGNGLGMAIYDLLLSTIVVFALYLGSLYVLESIVLGSYEYSDEVLKRKNLSYGIICFANSLAMAYLAKAILSISKESLIMLSILWLFAMAITGIAMKGFDLISKLPFHKLLAQKNIAVAFSYTGFIWGWTLLVTNSLEHDLVDLKSYSIQFLLKIILSAIVFPLFKQGLSLIYQLKDESGAIAPVHGVGINATSSMEMLYHEGPGVGTGLYEGVLFFTSAFLTGIITASIDFGSFYPVF
ncbi:MAG: hypothetical protein A2X86_07520 [Bdellovibrionales bacterium GWA2_49_15]|nr:MAG: hypothetical protein A2X86_07520 [Bdellovibrionales bacterium GWA2_49_15]HAZ11873.1 hypothetical protein [Bdellovibrionales bacterium]